MKFYLHTKNGVITCASNKDLTDDTIKSYKVSEDVYYNYLQYPDMYELKDGVISEVEGYSDKIAAMERAKLDLLYLTAADVERAIYKAKGIDFDDVIELVESSGVDIDVKALKIELNANNFYRGNKYINAVGALLGFTTEQLDAFFESGDYTALNS